METKSASIFALVAAAYALDAFHYFAPKEIKAPEFQALSAGAAPLIEGNPAEPVDGKVPYRLTAAGVAELEKQKAAAPSTDNLAPNAPATEGEKAKPTFARKRIELPKIVRATPVITKKREGKYPFDTLAAPELKEGKDPASRSIDDFYCDAFFVPNSPDMKHPGKTMGSAVSSANGKAKAASLEAMKTAADGVFVPAARFTGRAMDGNVFDPETYPTPTPGIAVVRILDTVEGEKVEETEEEAAAAAEEAARLEAEAAGTAPAA